MPLFVRRLISKIGSTSRAAPARRMATTSACPPTRTRSERARGIGLAVTMTGTKVRPLRTTASPSVMEPEIGATALRGCAGTAIGAGPPVKR